MFQFHQQISCLSSFADCMNRITPLSISSQKSMKVGKLQEFNINSTDILRGNSLNFKSKDKLLQLTRQCISYFYRFITEKDNQIKVVSQVFIDILHKVEISFGQVITEIQHKVTQIKDFLMKEQTRLLQQKCKQEQSLNQLLREIQDVHLTQVLQSQDQISGHLLKEYAITLQKFFTVMEDVEKDNYQDCVEQCVSFINNLIRQELKTILQQNLSRKIQDIVRGYQGDNCFTFQAASRFNQQTCSLIDPIDRTKLLVTQIQSIEQQQSQRSKRLQNYHTLVKQFK